MYLLTPSINLGEQAKSGKPCDKFMAPFSFAKPDITEKIDVPELGSLDDIADGNFKKLNI